MAKESEKIRLPELPIFKKYSLAVRQEFATPNEILATLERTTARIQKLLEKAEDERRRKEQAERSEADRIALAEQEARWTDEAQEADEAKDAHETPDDPTPVEREAEKLVFEEQYLSKDQEQDEDEYEARPFWEVDDEELEESTAAPVPNSATRAPKKSEKPVPPPAKKPKPRNKARPRPQVVPVSGRGKPLKGAKKPSAKKASARKTAKTKAKKKAGTKRKSKR
ncbi:MAG: hypothetical protein KY429_09120 [Actinobacteria bacterium]|nr:hypothetical protein [Actinomycetota bacterium]